MNSKVVAMRSRPTLVLTFFAALAAFVTCAPTIKAEEEADRLIKLSDGKIQLTAAKNWERQKPRTNIVEYEFSVPAVEDDTVDGRVTIMGAGGSIEANIGRWLAQFTQPDGASTKERSQIEEQKIAGQEVHLVDITGTFKDQPRGPFGPTTLRDNYRMLGAIISTEKRGQYFVKMYGPRKTIAANEKAFNEMINTLKVD